MKAAESRPLTASRPARVRSNIEPRAPAQRSAVSNGRRLFVEGDGRGAWSRRFYDLIAGHIADMGGRSVLGEAQVSLIKRASAIECELEQLEGKLSMGQEVDLDKFGRASGNLRRILESLGLKREPRDVTGETDQARLDRVLGYMSEPTP